MCGNFCWNYLVRIVHYDTFFSIGDRLVTYNYKCSECQKVFEVAFDGMVGVSIPDTSAVYCPRCGSDLTYRIISAVNFILKGDGWASKDTNNE